MWSTRLKNTEQVEISWKTYFFRYPNNWHFPKNYYRFWKSSKASSHYYFIPPFGVWPTSTYSTEQRQSILQPEISIHFALLRLRREKCKFQWHNFCKNNLILRNVIEDYQWWSQITGISMPCDRLLSLQSGANFVLWYHTVVCLKFICLDWIDKSALLRATARHNGMSDCL